MKHEARTERRRSSFVNERTNRHATSVERESEVDGVTMGTHDLLGEEDKRFVCSWYRSR